MAQFQRKYTSDLEEGFGINQTAQYLQKNKETSLRSLLQLNKGGKNESLRVLNC